MIRCAAPAIMQACSSFEATAPILNFQILRILIRILEKKFTGPPAHAATVVLLTGCQVDSANNQKEEPSLVQTMLVRISWLSPYLLV
jgi:hypothetical protein